MTETLPEGWRSVPFWSLFYRDKQIGFPGEELLSVYREYGVIRKEDRDDNHNRAGDDLASYQLVEPGDLVLNKMKTWQGSLGISGYRGIVSPAYFVYKSRNSESGEFLHYALRSRYYVTQYASFSKGVRPNQWDLQPEYLSMMRVLLPPLSTQKTIVKYLAQEIGEIDAMRAKLDELEQTLLKRRRAVILEATCQGSSTVGGPSESSSNGLPDREWRMLPLKFAMESAQTGVWGQPRNGGSDDVPCVRVADFDRLAIQVTEVPTFRRIVHAERIRCGLQRGDILVEKSGGTDKNPVGAAVAYMGDAPAVCSNFILRLRCRENHYPRFWLYVLHGSYIAGRTWNYVRQTTGIQNLDVNGFMSMRHPTPDFDEQRRIADHLDEVTGRIGTMLAKIDELKAFLVERRAALITDVVTGRKKIAS